MRSGTSTLEDLRASCNNEGLNEAVQKLAILDQQGLDAPSDVICTILRRCSEKKSLAAGRRVQSLLLKDKVYFSQSVLGDHLIRLFASCSCLQDATQAFAYVHKPTVYTWNAIISAHAKLDGGKEALQLFVNMQHKGINPDKFTFLPLLKACGDLATISSGRLMHDLINRNGLELDLSMSNSLLDMYLKCGSLHEGHKLFDTLPSKDLVSWGAMIAGCTQLGCGFQALELFKSMQQEGLVPNRIIYSSVLKACGSLGALLEGRLIYNQILRSELELDAGVANHLVDMYVQCNSLDEGLNALTSWPKRDVVSWGTLIMGYAQQGDGALALRLFHQMQEDGIQPDRVVFLSVLQACTATGSLMDGEIVHNLLIQNGLHLNVAVGSTLVDMYAKSGSLEEALNVLQHLQHRDVVSWGALISGYSQHERGHLAIEYFKEMQKDGVQPDNYIFSCTLKACGSVGALENGRLIHLQIVKFGLRADEIMGSSLVDMYVKCGGLVEGWETLSSMYIKDVVPWNALIAGYVQHCNYILAQECLQVMETEGVKPDGTTYVSVLAACSHRGSVEDGHWYFNAMVKNDITPTLEHFNCMTDLLGRVGHLNDAVKLLKSMPSLPNATGWTSLLAACKKFENLDLGKQCYHQILLLDQESAAGVTINWNYFEDFYMWEDVWLDEMRRKACT